MADIVYRIQMICRLLFDSTTTYKIFATAGSKLFKQAAPIGLPVPNIPVPKLDVVQIEQPCPKCGKPHKLYAKFVQNPKIDSDMQTKGFTSFPKDGKIKYICGVEIDLTGIRNQIEIETGRKIIL